MEVAVSDNFCVRCVSSVCIYVSLVAVEYLAIHCECSCIEYVEFASLDLFNVSLDSVSCAFSSNILVDTCKNY